MLADWLDNPQTYEFFLPGIQGDDISPASLGAGMVRELNDGGGDLCSFQAWPIKPSQEWSSLLLSNLMAEDL